MMDTLYRIFDADGALLYVGATMNPSSRLNEHSKLKPWWDEASTITLEHFASYESLIDAETQAIRTENPKYNQLHAKLPTWTRKPRGKSGDGTLFQRSSDGLWVGRLVVNGRTKCVSAKHREDAARKLADLRAAAGLEQVTR